MRRKLRVYIAREAQLVEQSIEAALVVSSSLISSKLLFSCLTAPSTTAPGEAGSQPEGKLSWLRLLPAGEAWQLRQHRCQPPAGWRILAGYFLAKAAAGESRRQGG